jgi:OPA family glycerol-3-phosphate transporter-like MFS transporter/OPA family sugar phosphate sensor protein UhpC-like MFS transporter
MESVAPTPSAPAASERFPLWLRIFEPAPAAPVLLTEGAAIQESYRAWRWNVLVSSIVGYATFYFVRKNLSTAMPIMEEDLGISKTQLGAFLTLHGVLYGVSKFGNGFFADRCNARAFMVIGLVASAVMNVIFGLSSAVTTLGVVWMINGWVQGMGFPPCARLLTHWFPPKQLATKMAIWNSSHSIGAGVIVVLCGYLVKINWRMCFLVPAAIALVIAVFLWLTLPDMPPSVGLPEIEGTQTGTASGERDEDHIGFILENVFRNKFIWVISISNLFVYILRYTVFDWGTSFLTQAKHVDITHASWMVAGFEIAGLIGALLAGWMTDRFFGGRAMRACVFYMILAGLSIFMFWKMAGESPFLNSALLCSMGFFIYGPQCLIGIAAANLATKRAAATAVGLTGFFGYFSTLFSGVGFGALVKSQGWNAGFAGLLGIAAIGTVLFLFAWPAKARGYSEDTGEQDVTSVSPGGESITVSQ